MSQTTIPTPPPSANAAVNNATSVASLKANFETAIMSGAKDVPLAIKTLAPLDPDIAAATSGSQAKNVWYPVVVSAVTWVATKYALGWDTTADAEVSCLVLVGGTAIVHWFASQLAAKARG